MLRLSHRSLGRVSNLCAKNRFRVQDKERGGSDDALNPQLAHIREVDAKTRLIRFEASGVERQFQRHTVCNPHANGMA